MRACFLILLAAATLGSAATDRHAPGAIVDSRNLYPETRHASKEKLQNVKKARDFQIRRSGLGAEKRAQCNADNCARAVSGSANGPVSKSAHASDCSSFFKVIVTPAVITSTIYVTPSASTMTLTASTNTITVTPSTSTTTLVASTESDTQTTIVTTSVSGLTTTTDVESYPPANKKRSTIMGTITSPGGTTVYATMVPKYASVCSGTSRYSSACSCFGISHATTTLTASTQFVTVTAATPVSSLQPSPSSATVTAATPVVTSSVTTTTSATASSTVSVAGSTYVDYIPCNQNINGPSDGFLITVVCEAEPSSPGQVLSSNPVADWDACVQAADNNLSCSSFEYVIATKQCTLYLDATGAYLTQAAAGMVFGHFNVG